MRARRVIGFFRETTRDQRGATLLEFAFAALIFLLTSLGVLDYGRMLLGYNVVSMGAREGARYAAVRGSASGHAASQTDVKNYVVRRSSGNLTATNVSVTWTPDNKPGSTVSVQVQYVFQPIVPILPQNSLTLSSTSQLVINR